MSNELYKVVLGGFVIGHGSKEEMDNKALEIPGARSIKTEDVEYVDNEGRETGERVGVRKAEPDVLAINLATEEGL